MSGPGGGDDAIFEAVAGTVGQALAGHLPGFAWTLGLPQAVLLALLERGYAEPGALEPLPERQYAAIVAGAPPAFAELLGLLRANRSADADAVRVDWLAHALATASLGSRHLWQDLGLSGREAVSALLRRHFRPLYERNTANLKWKRFLFAELGAAQGKPGLRPPGCGGCEQFAACFPAA
ncbi:nitrogen fixation protein NifQ [Janthinobacterium fluminis]|uniref:Nitrogen fixation protein NifQ n=1 Tax=Janthinobacterium fluminis TaxID=2987524 RepID=A0ABT5JUZ9_9BURK|nr:nitrogen fixation protein NifQ [Janthinobacterium fluminis]MDC8756321.1 nitrogen fixation protein NifQ [Janthinobacterium fluminis]